ncbi:hypothetical protein BABINDRAFT_163505 [Babjeviella inositovora NRRL Y-12698]|uniref:HECT-type E3 ubiquitin transferase n=1 Tax=Babjeviella inositovora NRRL Y-12698 TaxID=984486 RepID=A0A1E3QJ67_9ASCO|nr:uncharacterized protein BABINDRAFT_163505 [Babjeviella inositovora NRRL Y-12698]ODQ77494.1 hypothetical protein BABINDRAFT_163505 [Babjeviella inositovora NRRL Y-12698]
MIITKRDHAKLLERALPIKGLIEDLVSCDLALLPSKLNALTAWEKPKGDLCHWIPLLNRFDSILEDLVKKYALDAEHVPLRELDRTDQTLSTACLAYTALLLRHCSNKHIYASTHHLYNLVGSCSVPLRLATLHVLVLVAESACVTHSSKNAASAEVKARILALARFFPPATHNHSGDDHIGLYDCISNKKKIPSKWRALDFEYFKTTAKTVPLFPKDQPLKHDVKSKKDAPKDAKEDIAGKHGNSLSDKTGDTPAGVEVSRKASKKKKKTQTHTIYTEGLAHFTLPQDEVRKLSLAQIYDRAVSVPPAAWFQLGLKAPVAKAFNNQSFEALQLRENLVQIRCLAIAYIVCVNDTSLVTSQLFEFDPYIFSYLVDLVSPANSVSPPVYAAAVKALSCIAFRRTWSSDIVRALSANVSHGVLFQMLRVIYKAAKDEDPALDDAASAELLVEMLGRILETKSLAVSLTSAGLMTHLLDFLALRTTKRRISNASLHLLDALILSYPEMLDTFIDNEGFSRLVDAIVYEVNFAVANPEFAGGKPQGCIVHYEVSFRQAQYFKTLLKFVLHLLQTDTSDRMRNLFDSALLVALNEIVLRPQMFGPTIITGTLNILATIIHNEPSSYAILQEAGCLDRVLANYATLFGPSSGLFTAMVEIVEAICLNTVGLKKVIDMGILPTFFQSFLVSDYSKDHVRAIDTSNTEQLGSLIEELGRHYPELRPIIVQEVIKLAAAVPRAASGLLPGTELYTSPQGAFYHSISEDVLNLEKGAEDLKEWEITEGSFMVDRATLFLSSLVQESGMARALMEKMPFARWLDFLAVANAPYDFVFSDSILSITGVLKFLDEEDRKYGLGDGSIIDALLAWLESVDAFLQFDHAARGTSAFLAMARDGQISAASSLLQNLAHLSALLVVFMDIYCNPYNLFPVRITQLSQIFAGAKGQRLMELLGCLFQSCALEEAFLRCSMPDEATTLTSPPKNPDVPPLQFSHGELSLTPVKNDKNSAKYKNSVQIRFLTNRIQVAVAACFSAMANLPMAKKQEAQVLKASLVATSNHLATTLIRLMDVTVDDPAAQGSYVAVVVNLLCFVLTGKSRTGQEHLQTVLAICFMQQGGFMRSRAVLVHHWQLLYTLDTERLRAAQNLKYLPNTVECATLVIISQLLNLFTKVLNGDQIEKIPAVNHLYNNGIINAQEVSANFVVQAKLLLMGFLDTVMDGKYPFDEDIITRLTPLAIHRFLEINRFVFTNNGELHVSHAGALAQLDSARSSSKVAYLRSLGMPEAVAVDFVKEHDVYDVPAHQPDDIDDDEWDGIVEKCLQKGYVKPEAHLVSPQYREYRFLNELDDLRAKNRGRFLERWLLIPQFSPKSVFKVHEVVDGAFEKDPEDIPHVVLEYLYSFDMADVGNKEKLASMLTLLSLFMSDSKVFYRESTLELVDEFMGFFEDVLQPEHLNQPWFSKALLVFERILSYSDIPVAEELAIEGKLRFPVVPGHPSISRETYEGTFMRVLALDVEISDIDTAISLTRILILFGRRTENTSKMIEAGVVKRIVTSVAVFNASDKFFILQESLIALFRRCFESPEVIRRTMEAELRRVLATKGRFSPGTHKDINVVVKETSAMVVRAPEVYVEVGSKEMRIHDCTKPLMTSLVELAVPPILEGPSAKPLDDPTGIMDLLLSELMAAKKHNWFEDPEPSEPFTSEQVAAKEADQKAKDALSQFKGGITKNPHCAYACFLLQAMVELLASYKLAKIEFVSYSKKHKAFGVAKASSTSMNFLLHQVLPTHSLADGKADASERPKMVSRLAKMAIVAFVSSPLGEDGKKEDPDMQLIRKYTVESIARVLQEAFVSSDVAKKRFGMIVDLVRLSESLVLKEYRECLGKGLDKGSTELDCYYIGRLMLEKALPAQFSAVISDVDFNFPGAKEVINACIGPLRTLCKLKIQFQDLFRSAGGEGEGEEEEALSDDDKEDTPDLFKNSTLGMYDVEDSEEEEDYDEMDYDEREPLEVVYSEDEVTDEELEEDSDDVDMEEPEAWSGEDVSMSEPDEITERGFVEIETEDSSSEMSEESLQSEISFDDDFDDDEISVGSDDALDEWMDNYASDGEETGPTAFLEDDDDEEEDELESDIDSAAGDYAIVESGIEHFANGGVGNRRGSRSGMIEDLMSAFGELSRANGGSIFREGGGINVPGSDAISILDRLFDKKKKDKLSLAPNFVIKSTLESWKYVAAMFSLSHESYAAAPAILNRIFDVSLELSVAKRAAEEQARAARTSKLQVKREERERQRRESETARRNAPVVTPAVEPILMLIGGREVDISGTDIDPDFFEALPEDMREEVFTQHIRERRAEATVAGGDTREIDPQFLDALPPQIREEILQQEAMANRFEETEELDNDEAIEGEEEEEEETDVVVPKLKQRLFFTPLLDRAGVASLTKLMFLPQTFKERGAMHALMEYLCSSKQTRTEILGLLLSVLEGTGGQKSLEKCYAQLCSRVKKGREAGEFPVGATPLVVATQTLEALQYLLEADPHTRFYFLVEHEAVRKGKKKFKDTIDKAKKYPVNALLAFVEKKLVQNEPILMDLVSRVVQVATRPLALKGKTEMDKNNDGNATLGSMADHVPAALHALAPLLSEASLTHLVSILIADECSSRTFQQVLGAMQNLSLVSNALTVFPRELSLQASRLGGLIVGDLRDLATDITSTPAAEELCGITINKFVPPSSDQAKLLRVLTALDYLFGGTQTVEQLSLLYTKIALGPLWDALSSCLRVLEERAALTNVATVLLPLIEALMVVCKHSRVKDLQTKDVYTVRKDFLKEPIESLFFAFTDEHKKILNLMVRVNPKLMSGPFAMLVKNPRVLEFDNKRNYFDRQLHKDGERPTLNVSVGRDLVFLDSYRALFFKSKEEMKNAKLDIKFKGEDGVDAGGVTREWYLVLSRQMFNPDYALFAPVASDKTTFHPNRTSWVNPEHLSFFKFIGRIIGKAIYDGFFLDCHFSRAVYKQILGCPLSLKDMETLDLEYFKSLIWMLENDITDIIIEDFSVETDDYGEHKVIDLIPDGRNVPVTQENKQDYVRRVVAYRLQTSIAEQMDNFLQGFHDIIPRDLIAIFDEQELELLISGLPDIDVDDWKNNSNYVNYSGSSPQIQWFWRAVRSFDVEERAKLLQFATGTSKVPLNGFKELSGVNGIAKFSIHRDYGKTDRLPSSHTCFNQIDLPEYDSYEQLRGSLLLATTEGHEGFGLA